MHKHIYASGFLYHLPTQQILLQHTQDQGRVSLSLFTGESDNEIDGAKLFRSVIQKQLALTLAEDAIFPIYEYVHTNEEGNHFTFYAELTEGEEPPVFHDKAGWYSLKQIAKLKLSPQAKQDIIVGHRVILALEREKIEQETPRETQ